MAGEYVCDNGDGFPVAYTIGDADTGQQLFLCLPCTILWARMVAQTADEIDGEESPPPEAVAVGVDGAGADAPALSPPQPEPTESEIEEPEPEFEGGQDDARPSSADELGDRRVELGERERARGTA